MSNSLQPKRLLVFGVCLSLFSRIAPVRAEMCVIDVVPAATILVPYFEVDVGRCGQSGGTNTTFSIQNVTATKTIAHVTVWSDWSVPLFAFDVPLPGNAVFEGYDVAQVDLKAVLCDGNVPSPGTVYPTPFTSGLLEHYRAWLQGKPSPLTANCAGSLRTDTVATGYVTIDNVATTGLGFPSGGSTYFASVLNDNQLTSHVYIETFATRQETAFSPGTGRQVVACNQKRKKARKRCKRKHEVRNALIEELNADTTLGRVTTSSVEYSRGIVGYPAVHVEAAATFTSTSTTSGKTFYGRYVTGGTDHREPLPSVFAVRFAQTESPPAGFDIVAWKEGGPEVVPRACGTFPAWYPLNDADLVVFGEAHDALDLANTNVTPVEASVARDFLLTTPVFGGSTPPDAAKFANGWLYYNLNSSGGARQAWILTRRDGRIDGAGVTVLAGNCD